MDSLATRKSCDSCFCFRSRFLRISTKIARVINEPPKSPTFPMIAQKRSGSAIFTFSPSVLSAELSQKQVAEGFGEGVAGVGSVVSTGPSAMGASAAGTAIQGIGKVMGVGAKIYADARLPDLYGIHIAEYRYRREGDLLYWRPINDIISSGLANFDALGDPIPPSVAPAVNPALPNYVRQFPFAVHAQEYRFRVCFVVPLTDPHDLPAPP